MRFITSFRRRSRFWINLAVFLCICLGAFTFLNGKSGNSLLQQDSQIIFVNKKHDFKEVKLLNQNEDKAVGENPQDAMKIERELEEKKKAEKKDSVEKPPPVAPPKVVKPPGNVDIQNRIYEKQFEEELAAVVPGLGELGVPAEISEEDAKKLDEVMKVEAFNKLVSDKMSLNRTLPDVRSPKCRNIKYDDDLPQASVIIIFTNEAWSPLLRTIHSVLNRSPAHLLKEIVLVDDFSDKEDLKGKLEYYISSRLPVKVRLVRLKERHGLIRARLAGAKEAVGDVIIFLDSHCEATEGWLEPLLARIKESRKAVLVPIIDVIDDKTLQYFSSNGEFFQIGGFTWSGHFTWINVPEKEKKRRGSPVGPTRSPTMAGGLFAMDRKYFWELGSYDEGMDVWGGENLEMSFRIWMCGGTLETIPCSRVGHIFRSFHPYSFPGNKDTHGLNTARMAEVWMDDYKRLFYMHRPELQTDPLVGSVEERKKLREKMECKSFKWFLDNVIPEKFVLDEHAIAYGKVRNTVNGNSLCLDTLQRNEDEAYVMGLYPCHEFLASSQFVSLSQKNQLRREEVCATVGSADANGIRTVRMLNCVEDDYSQKWVYTEKQELQHSYTSLCLDRGTHKSMTDAFVSKCDGSDSQKWTFDHS